MTLTSTCCVAYRPCSITTASRGEVLLCEGCKVDENKQKAPGEISLSELQAPINYHPVTEHVSENWSTRPADGDLAECFRDIHLWNDNTCLRPEFSPQEQNPPYNVAPNATQA